MSHDSWLVQRIQAVQISEGRAAAAKMASGMAWTWQWAWACPIPVRNWLAPQAAIVGEWGVRGTVVLH